MPYLSPALNVMIAAARKAARGLTRDFGELENLQVSMKGPGDFVSNADRRTEKILIEELSKARPGYGFLCEESGRQEGSDKSHRFIIDPLDGTTNFLHSVPIFAISIALEREGQLVSGLVYNPIVDEMYVAEKGHGAYLNDKRLHVAARRSMSEALFATGLPFSGKPGHALALAEVAEVLAVSPGIRRCGSAALDLCGVAMGRYDGFWERGINAWDMAAGIIIAREAGALVTDMNGGQDMLTTGGVIATNEALFPQIRDLLAKGRKKAIG
ncbi:MAG: inositol monophosphatase family protein [Rhizomicrobium sp.]